MNVRAGSNKAQVSFDEDSGSLLKSEQSAEFMCPHEGFLFVDCDDLLTAPPHDRLQTKNRWLMQLK